MSDPQTALLKRKYFYRDCDIEIMTQKQLLDALVQLMEASGKFNRAVKIKAIR